MFQNIEINKIFPHRDNPRKDLGDLTELAESIKAKGIMQNLTVVPWFSEITGQPADNGKMDGYYTVVIGHRRLAAAKLAGLKEVPCSVVEMDRKEQVETMLLENMQRSDLTVYEQAQGFQMMLDLGVSVENLSERTGFSQSTVRHRMKLLELDHDKFQKSNERGATLQDYLELEKIKSIDMRNKVLEKIGTQNFNYELKNAIDKEMTEKYKDQIIAELEKFAKMTINSSGMRYAQTFYCRQKSKVTIPEDVENAEYFYVVSGYGYITLYAKTEQTEAIGADYADKQEQAKKAEERRVALKEISERVYQVRKDFIKKCSGTLAKKHIRDILEYSMRLIMSDDYCDYDEDEFANIFDLETDDEGELRPEDIAKQFAASPEKTFLASVYCATDAEKQYYFNWSGSHCENDGLDQVYDLLEKLGYQVSDEERALRDGTHELFSTEEGAK
jgi:ParB family chromosome partitioning protein